jgi:hypothetical protein
MVPKGEARAIYGEKFHDLSKIFKTAQLFLARCRLPGLVAPKVFKAPERKELA